DIADVVLVEAEHRAQPRTSQGLTGPGQPIFMESLKIDSFFKVDLGNPRRLQRPVPLVHRLQVVRVDREKLGLPGWLGHRADRITKEIGVRARFPPCRTGASETPGAKGRPRIGTRPSYRPASCGRRAAGSTRDRAAPRSRNRAA